jgi:heptosyltransferase-1
VSSPRILILRTSALGDIVQALPVLSRLRSSLPTATIGWVVERAFAPLLEGHPDVDALIVADLRPWRHRLHQLATWRQIVQFVARLQAFSAEIVLDLMGNHKAGVLAASTLADRRLGLARSFRREPSSAVWISEPVSATGAHAVDHMLSVLDGLDLAAGPVDFAGAGLPERCPPIEVSEQRFAIIHPTTAWPNKTYPQDSWGQVAALLAAELDLAVLVAPGPGEEGVASEVAAAAASARVRALPPTSLPSLIYLQRRARLVVGGDTGPLHLAHALGTPALFVMGPTDPARHGPYGAPRNALWHRLPCSFCHRRLDGPRACLLAIKPRAVVRLASEILGDRIH